MRYLMGLFNLSLVLLLSGCGNGVKSNQRPEWINNPGPNHVVGRCSTHVSGYAAQEQCAYKKGLAYIAMSKGISVDIVADTTMKQSSTDKTGNSYGHVQANIKMEGKDIKVNARIIDKWHDKSSDIVYVLIEEN